LLAQAKYTARMRQMYKIRAEQMSATVTIRYFIELPLDGMLIDFGRAPMTDEQGIDGSWKFVDQAVVTRTLRVVDSEQQDGGG
jgi:hypothetical protein